MRYLQICLGGFLFLWGCSSNDVNSYLAQNEMIEYKLQPGQYAVVVIMEDGVGYSQARKAARHRAAELAVSGGYKYFLIQSESEIRVMKQIAQYQGGREEMLIEGDFGPAQISQAATSEKVHQAIRMVFQCFEVRPKGKVFNACKWADCSKIQMKSSNTP